MEQPPATARGPSNVFLQVVDEPSLQASGFTLVYIPPTFRNTGQGFRFTLPDRAVDEPAPSETTLATLINGDALPDWLGFDARTRSFVAASVPVGGLPMRVRVRSGRKTSIVELLETTS